MQRNYLPVGTNADVMHVEFDCFGLLLVLKVIISQQIEDLVNDWGCGGASCWKGRDLNEQTKTKTTRI